MSLYGKGLKPSTPEKTARRREALTHTLIAMAITVGIRGSADLGQHRPPRMDQGRSSTCFAHSGSACAYTARSAAGTALPFVPSPRSIASCTYSGERGLSTPAGVSLPLLQDTGAQLADCAASMFEDGITSIGGPTADGRYSDVEDLAPGEPFPEPDVAALELAALTVVEGEYKISPNANAPRTVAAALDVNVPVWVGFFCDSAFENLPAGQVAGAPDQSDPNGGGHAVYITAYRTNVAGKLEFRIENSWGSDWCENGSAWVSEAWIAAAWELWPFAIDVKEAA